MNQSNLPEWLIEARKNAPAPVLPEDLPQPEPASGQLWLVNAAQGPRVMVLVVRCHDDEDFVQVLFCNNEYDLAADTDSVLQPEDTGCPYQVLVHGDLTGPVMKDKLWRSIGEIDVELVKFIWSRGMRMGGFDASYGRGLPIISRSDARWEYKERLCEELWTVMATPEELGI